MTRVVIVAISITCALATALSAQTAPRELALSVGKSLVLDSPLDVARVSVADDTKVQAVPVTAREVVLNGKAAGETSVIVWQKGGDRLLFNVRVDQPDEAFSEARRQLASELKDQSIELSKEGENIYVRGTAKDLVSADRAIAIAATAGKPVNLLHVAIPDGDPQILLRVKFANLDRRAIRDLGATFFSLGGGNTIGRVTTQQFPAPNLETQGGTTVATFSDFLNLFLFNRDLNLGTALKLLQEKSLIEILAEPNLLAINGKEASFLAGGEFPYPVVQGVGTAGGFAAITIRFREFGIRLNFVPTITSRGSIRLHVAPEVSALDYSNGLVYQGFNIPGLTTRKVATDIELEEGQSFAIAGLLDNRMTETFRKMPGLGDIPWLGKIFQSQSKERNKTELLVLVTPEFVYPIEKGRPTPEIQFPEAFMQEGAKTPPRTPGVDVTGQRGSKGNGRTIPQEALKAEIESQQKPSGSTEEPLLYQVAPIAIMPAASGSGTPPSGSARPQGR